MARARPLRFSQRKHPLWLLVALAVGVLVGLTSPGAHARPVAVLLNALARDLGALRVQLEQVAARPPETGASSIAFAADLGDGGHGFHRAAMLATLRTAHRSAASLDRRYRETGDPVRLDTVEKLVLRLYDMERWLVAIGRAPDAAALQLASQSAEATLRDLDQMLAALRSRGAPPLTPTGASGESRDGPAFPTVLGGLSSP